MSEQLAQAVLQLENMYFDEFSFKRGHDIAPGVINYSFSFNRDIQPLDEIGRLFRVSLTCIIEEKEKRVELHVRVVGDFSIACDDDSTKKQLVEKNSLSVLFPHVRSMVAILSAQSGLPTIMLPIVNIVEMFNDNQ